VMQILIAAAFILVIALFAFQMWRVWRTGHVRWRVQKHHRDHRPVAFWIEIAACAAGMLVFAGLLIATLMQWGAEAG